MTVSKASARAKIILIGEHAIMYGGTAIAMAINRRLTVTLEDGGGVWEPTNAKENAMIADMAAFFGRQLSRVSIESDIPIGAGLGSSAALSVAVCAALHGRVDSSLEEASWRAEHFFHGNPSGIDTGTSLRGGVVFKRGKAACQAIKLDLPPLLIVNTGIPHSTIQINQQLRDRWTFRSQEIMDALSQLAEKFLVDADLPEMFHRAHELLTELGVVDDLTKQFVVALKELGIAAKITGAGMGGCVLVQSDDFNLVEKMAQDIYGISVTVFPAIPDWEGAKLLFHQL